MAGRPRPDAVQRAAFHALAASGSEPPFATVQAIVPVAFVALTIAATLRSRPPRVVPA
jgi:hypothetical protein